MTDALSPEDVNALIKELRERDQSWQKQCDGWEARIKELHAADYDPETFTAMRRTLYGRAADALTADRASCQARVEELEANLETRDKFIVDQGLWPAFVASLPLATLRALADRKEGDA